MGNFPRNEQTEDTETVHKPKTNASYMCVTWFPNTWYYIPQYKL